MSRSGSRYPSAFGHTPSYRSYVRGGMDSGPIGYSVSTPGPSTDYSKFSAFNPGNTYDLGLGSNLGGSGVGAGAGGGLRDLGGLGGGDLGTTSSSSSSSAQKVSSYSSSYR